MRTARLGGRAQGRHAPANDQEAEYTRAVLQTSHIIPK